MAPSTSNTTQAGPSGAGAPADVEVENTIDELEHLVQFLLTTQNPQAVLQRLKTISKADSREQLIAGVLPSGQDPLDILDPEAQTLGYLYILSARLHHNTPPPQSQHVESFCKKFNPSHARLAPERVTALARNLVRASADNLKLALTPLYDLVLRYPPNLSYLTTIHPIFLNVCVTTRHFTAALPILSVPILNIDMSISDLHYNDNLLYHYAGGVVYGALKRWREAEEFFEIVVTSPAQTAAAIQYEALKKLILVQLILYGKALPAPKYAPTALPKLFKGSPYATLSKIYPQTVPALNSAVQKDIETFKTDQNWGLVQQVIDRAPRWLIKKLTLTFLTLGLSDIGREVGLETEEVRSVVLSMVEDGDINASISVDDTVTFADSTPHFTKAEVDNALVQAQAQSRLLQDIERALNASKDYLHKALKHKDESWGVEDDMYGASPSGGAGGWADESMYA